MAIDNNLSGPTAAAVVLNHMQIREIYEAMQTMEYNIKSIVGGTLPLCYKGGMGQSGNLFEFS